MFRVDINIVDIYPILDWNSQHEISIYFFSDSIMYEDGRTYKEYKYEAASKLVSEAT